MSQKPLGKKYPDCPHCTTGYIGERTNKQTQHTFLGCSEWPKCEYTDRGGENPSPVRVAACYEEEYDDFDYFDLEDGPGSSDWY